MKRGTFVLASALLLTALGCGGNGLTAIHGTVTLDGQPLQRGRIELEPSGRPGPIAAAEIVDGKYEVRVMRGTKTVRISGGKVIGQHHFAANPANPMVEDISSLVPTCYNTETTLTCEVARGQTTYDFHLKSSTP